jgi:CRP/FNR family cyclic AMP-dependent transcriptional regulator
MSQRVTYPAFLSHHECDVLTSAAAEDLERNPDVGRVRTYAKNACLWLSDDRLKRVYLLKSGRIEIASISSQRVQELIRIVEPGELFGELCFCAHRLEPLGTVARALTKSIVAEGSYVDFQRPLSSGATSATRLLETFCRRVADMERRTRVLACRDARKRLAMALIDLCELRGAIKDAGDRAIITVSHAELADRVAMTRTHTTVLMTRFRKQRLVSYRRNSALTVDVRRLREAYA